MPAERRPLTPPHPDDPSGIAALQEVEFRRRWRGHYFADSCPRPEFPTIPGYLPLQKIRERLQNFDFQDVRPYEILRIGREVDAHTLHPGTIVRVDQFEATRKQPHQVADEAQYAFMGVVYQPKNEELAPHIVAYRTGLALSPTDIDTANVRRWYDISFDPSTVVTFPPNFTVGEYWHEDYEEEHAIFRTSQIFVIKPETSNVVGFVRPPRHIPHSPTPTAPAPTSAS
jgi:hypothetical protein